MNKKLISVLIICSILSLGFVFAEDNESLNNNSIFDNEKTIIAIESGDSNISFEDGYKGYCAEWGEHSAEEGQKFIVKNTSQINNNNYLKTMFLFFHNQTQKDVYATQHMVWKFTDDKQFSRFNQTWYNQIIETGDKYTIPDSGKIPINETHQFSFDFKLFMPLINEFQNFFAYQFLIEETPNEPDIQINNSTINNSTTLLPNHQNNNNSFEYNDIYDYNNIKNNDISIGNHQTGINLWALGCVIVMLITIWIANKYN